VNASHHLCMSCKVIVLLQQQLSGLCLPEFGYKIV
jgi:hypothetical protein